MTSEHLRSAKELLEYIWSAPTPFHAVETTVERLKSAGFTALEESAAWEIETAGGYYVTRNDSSIIAFIAGSGYPSNNGFRLVGAHTDSPNLRLKPQPEIREFGYAQLGVEVYGGVLLATWTDRDLGLAGRVVVENESGAPESRVLRIDRPIARIPQLAIHLNRTVNTEGLILNRETHLPPVLALASEDSAGFLDWLGGELGVKPERILSHELMFHDVQRPSIGGWNEEFLYAPRLDNLASCHAGLEALLADADTEMEATRAIVLYDNEEIGSATLQGAGGTFLYDVLQRISAARAEKGSSSEEAFHRARAQSLLISADMAHAVHPNYADLHEKRHLPALNQGPVIKVNASAKYATDAESSAQFRRFCRAADVPCQSFVMRADLACGSTIGPISATRLGIRTVDVGNPMLSMHSCREMAGTQDHLSMIRALTQFFQG